MRRTAACVLLSICILAGTAPLHAAGSRSPSARAAQKQAKKQQKVMRKYIKTQQKANRKALKKAHRDAQRHRGLY